MSMGVVIYLSKGNLLMAPLLLPLLSNHKLPIVSQGEMEPYEPLPIRGGILDGDHFMHFITTVVR